MIELWDRCITCLHYPLSDSRCLHNEFAMKITNQLQGRNNNNDISICEEKTLISAIWRMKHHIQVPQTTKILEQSLTIDQRKHKTLSVKHGRRQQNTCWREVEEYVKIFACRTPPAVKLTEKSLEMQIRHIETLGEWRLNFIGLEQSLTMHQKKNVFMCSQCGFRQEPIACTYI